MKVFFVKGLKHCLVERDGGKHNNVSNSSTERIVSSCDVLI